METTPTNYYTWHALLSEDRRRWKSDMSYSDEEEAGSDVEEEEETEEEKAIKEVVEACKYG